jgi:hypothetical protein
LAPRTPLYYENNIQGVGKCDFREAQTLKNRELVEITREVNGYDNVILEICDEPSLYTPHADAGPWVGRMLEVAHEAESGLPKKHLLAQEVHGPIGGPIDFSGSPILSVIVGEYVWEGNDGEMGGVEGLDYQYHHNKPIEMNETPYYPFQYRTGDAVGASRVEAWEFIVGGGASFNHLNARFTAEDPAGKTPDNAQILGALRNLKDFIYSFDFVKMRADKSFVVSGIPRGAYCRGISQPGEQYALYHHHSQLDERSHQYYIVAPGIYRETLALDLPPGSYEADWLDPASGKLLNSSAFSHQGGTKRLLPPSTGLTSRYESNGLTEACSQARKWIVAEPDTSLADGADGEPRRVSLARTVS